jgi:two-component system, NarL family, invasion response regulator UvrY
MRELLTDYCSLLTDRRNLSVTPPTLTYCVVATAPVMMHGVKLLLASDEPLIRRGFHNILTGRDGWAVAAEAASPGELVEALGRAGADVAVLALPFGEFGGVQLVQEVREAAGTMPVVVLAAYLVEHYATAFLRAGANAFLRRTAEPDEILRTIEAVANGKRYVAPNGGGPEPPHRKLSTRELEVFLLLAAGHAPTAIAAMLQLSVKTVSTYRARILEKTGFRSNADIVGYAIRNRLV